MFYAEGGQALLDEGILATVARSSGVPDALFWALITAGLVAAAGLTAAGLAGSVPSDGGRLAGLRHGPWLVGVGLLGAAVHPASALPALAVAGWLVTRRPARSDDTDSGQRPDERRPAATAETP